MTSDDSPMTLAEVCEIVFRGTIKPSTLRAEAAKGRLDISRIGKRDFTTLRAVREMQERCLVAHKAPGSGSTKDVGHGSSETARLLSARAALEATVRELRKPSQPTLESNTVRRRTTTL